MNRNFKSLVLVIIALITISIVQAQQVDFNDLKKDNSTNSEINSSKKWIKELNATEDVNIAKKVLSTELVKMTKSKHWFSLSTDGEITNELSFQTSKKMHLDRVLENIKEAGFKLSSTKTSTDSKTFIYTNNKLTIEVLALTTENTATTVYLVTLL